MTFTINVSFIINCLWYLIIVVIRLSLHIRIYLINTTRYAVDVEDSFSNIQPHTHTEREAWGWNIVCFETFRIPAVCYNLL